MPIARALSDATRRAELICLGKDLRTLAYRPLPSRDRAARLMSGIAPPGRPNDVAAHVHCLRGAAGQIQGQWRVAQGDSSHAFLAIERLAIERNPSATRRPPAVPREPGDALRLQIATPCLARSMPSSARRRMYANQLPERHIARASTMLQRCSRDWGSIASSAASKASRACATGRPPRTPPRRVARCATRDRASGPGRSSMASIAI